MKICANCGATAFDDMEFCYGCLTSFVEKGEDSELLEEVEEPFDMVSISVPLSTPESIEEPPVLFSESYTANLDLQKPPSEIAPLIRIRVEFPGQFLYNTYLASTEGSVLTIGCAADNNIIIPQTEVGRHQLSLRYSQGQLWLEDHGSTRPVLVDNIPLSGTQGIRQGTAISLGNALLTVNDT